MMFRNKLMRAGAVVFLSFGVANCASMPQWTGLGGRGESSVSERHARAASDEAMTASAENEVSSSRLLGAGGDSADLERPRRPVTYAQFGSGQFVDSQARSRDIDEGEPVTLNLVNVDLADAVQRILGDILDANYAIETDLDGEITIQTRQPASPGRLLELLSSALAENGAALVNDDGFYRVVAEGQTARAAGGARVSAPGARSIGGGLHVIPLRYVAASRLAEVMEEVTRGGSVHEVDAERNLLIVSGSDRDVAAMLDLAAVFDVDWMDGMSFALVPLIAADAQSVAQELEQVFAGGEGGDLSGLLRIVAIRRLNAVLVVSPQAAYIRRAQTWISRLDEPSGGAERRYFVIDIQNRPAAEIAEIIQSVSGDAGPRLGSSSASPFGDGGATALPDSAAPGEVAALQASGDGELAGVSVFADEANNSLIVLATPQQLRGVRRVVETLDAMPNQVLLEAMIAEVRLSDELRFGLNWAVESGEFDFAFSEFATGAVTSTFPGFSVLFSGRDARAALNAVSSVTDVNVISSPSLMVLDNRTAILQVGDQVPIITQSSVSVLDPDAPIVNSVTLRDTGVILRVTPRVNDSGLVVLDVEQEVSDVVETVSSGIDSPTIQQRRLQTSVVVRDGETVALGGLIRDRESLGTSGIPVLSRIPGIGAAFRSNNQRQERTELIVLITPRVVRDVAEARSVTDELRRRIRGVRPLVVSHNESIED